MEPMTMVHCLQVSDFEFSLINLDFFAHYLLLLLNYFLCFTSPFKSLGPVRSLLSGLDNKECLVARGQREGRSGQ